MDKAVIERPASSKLIEKTKKDHQENINPSPTKFNITRTVKGSTRSGLRLSN
jgi:hypothetical protein